MTKECEVCHNVYTERYGSDVENPRLEWRWLCFPCQDARQARKEARRG
jgi:hypothetical protein